VAEEEAEGERLELLEPVAGGETEAVTELLLLGVAAALGVPEALPPRL